MASDPVLRAHRDNLGDACVPVVRVRTVTDRRTSEVPLVDQSLDGVQSFCTIEVGATDAGASDRIGQVRIREVGTGQVRTEPVRTTHAGTNRFGIGQFGTIHVGKEQVGASYFPSRTVPTRTSSPEKRCGLDGKKVQLPRYLAVTRRQT